MEIGDTPLRFGSFGKPLSGVYSPAQPSLSLTAPPAPPASHSHKPSLIIEDGLPVFWAAPSLPRPHHWPPVPQAGEVHLVLQPWRRAQASLGMDARHLQASLVSPAFLYSLCLRGAQLHTPLWDDPPLINKHPFWFMFISPVSAVNYTALLSQLPSLFFLLRCFPASKSLYYYHLSILSSFLLSQFFFFCRLIYLDVHTDSINPTPMLRAVCTKELLLEVGSWCSRSTFASTLLCDFWTVALPPSNPQLCSFASELHKAYNTKKDPIIKWF